MGLRSKRRLRARRAHPFLPSDGPLTVALDATTDAVGVAIARADTILVTRRTLHTSPKGTTLSTVLTEALAEIGATQTDIAAVVSTRGPGSFTGVRLTLMAAKALAWSLDIPLVTVDTPLVMAHQAQGPAAVALDARQGEVYLAIYDSSENLTAPMEPLAPEDAAARIAQLPSTTALLGTGFPAYESLRALRPGPARATDFPDPSSLLALGLVRLAAEDTDDPLTAEPLYIREFRPTAPPKA